MFVILREGMAVDFIAGCFGGKSVCFVNKAFYSGYKNDKISFFLLLEIQWKISLLLL